jgi:hypothetical protein
MRKGIAGWALLLLPAGCPAMPPSAVTEIVVDAGADRHPISPLIYGTAFADAAAIADLGLALNRAGGNSASLYDWRHEARNAGRDWYFESLPIAADDPAQYGTRFVATTRTGGAAAMLTVPMIGWSAKLAPDGGKAAGFAISKYGPQAARDTDGFPDAGNGLRPGGDPITGNDPHDAASSTDLADRRAWLDSLVARWGRGGDGGVRFYAMDNEPSRWHDIHRDVHPVGLHADEMARAVIDTARMVKTADPTAQVVAPEEWGWNGYRYSGFDQQIGDAHGYRDLPDRTRETGGLDLIPWLLTTWKAAGHPVDVVSVHYYPQGGEYREQGDDVSPAMQRLRNRSTRSLWDPTYTDESWIAEPVALIPRLRNWVDRYYDRGTPIAITEYDWGGERDMNGATAQADILGIFGREGLYMATRWATPARGTPTYLAMKLYRNYDSHGAGFGETSVAAHAPDPDDVVAFAALRRDGALTIVAINKRLDRAAPIALHISRFGTRGTVTGAVLAKGSLETLDRSHYGSGVLTPVLPPQSVTLFVLTPDVR